MVDISLAASNFSIYASNNSLSCTSGFMIFFASPLDGIKQIYLYNNTETLGGAATGSKGLIGIDSPSNSVISFNTKIYSAKNTVPLLRADYTDLVAPAANQPRVVAYATARFTPGVNKYDMIIPLVGNTNSGAVVPVDISGLESKTQNLNATTTLNTLTKSTLFTLNGAENVVIADNLGVAKMTVNNINTTLSGDIIANGFLKTGGTNQQYLMANGSVLQYSANSGNSNFYLYNSSNTVTSSPSSGQITYNNASQSSATIIYISHLSSDNIDIEIFYSQLSSLNDVYIQDRNSSQNNIQYNITGAPTITVDSKIAIPVTVSTSQGTGATSFGSNHPVLISFFTNSIETDIRLSNLETNTQNLTATASDSTFSKTLKMNSQRIQSVAEPVNSTDATTKNYVDTANNLKLNLSGGTMTGALLMNNNNISGVGNFTLFNSTSNGIAYFSAGFLANANKDYYIQSGGTTIQSMITQISLSAGNTIRLSSGAWTENVTCFNQNYTVCGAPCALFNQMTQITGNITFGSSTSAVSPQTRIRLKDLKIIGNLIFTNDSVYQELRTYIDNCDISGTITFPTSVVNTSGLGIFFTNCSFSGSNNPLTTIPNQTLYTIYFTDCTFNSQPITNNLTVGNFSRLIFTNCSILPSLSLGNCVLNGLNASAITSSLTAGNLTIGTTSTSALSTIVNIASFSMTFLGTTVTGFKARYITDGTNKIVTITTPSGTIFTNTGANTSGFTATGSPIPAAIIPTTSTTSFIRVYSGGTNLPLAFCVISNSGGFSFGMPDLSNSFIGGAVVGFQGHTTITYST